VSAEFVPPVEARRIGAEKPFHPGHQIGLRGFEHQSAIQTPSRHGGEEKAEAIQAISPNDNL
jgi:hypothetical protein